MAGCQNRQEVYRTVPCSVVKTCIEFPSETRLGGTVIILKNFLCMQCAKWAPAYIVIELLYFIAPPVGTIYTNTIRMLTVLRFHYGLAFAVSEN